MALLFPIRWLLGAGLVLATCLSLSARGDVARGWSASAWACLGVDASTPGNLRIDIDADGDVDRLAVDHALTVGTVWENEHTDGRALFRIPDHLALPDFLDDALHSTPTDDSDSSDPSVRAESRGGPSTAQPAGTVPAVSPIAPRSRTFSSSTPRGPPVVLHLA